MGFKSLILESYFVYPPIFMFWGKIYVSYFCFYGWATKIEFFLSSQICFKLRKQIIWNFQVLTPQRNSKNSISFIIQTVSNCFYSIYTNIELHGKNIIVIIKLQH